MEERETLLRKWAELAPGECQVEDGFFWVRLAGVLRNVALPSRDGISEAVLLSALIVTIRARGWHYSLASDEMEPENEQPAAWHRAAIYTDSNVIPWCWREKAEPCDALLDAYVSSLQATEGGRKPHEKAI